MGGDRAQNKSVIIAQLSISQVLICSDIKQGIFFLYSVLPQGAYHKLKFTAYHLVFSSSFLKPLPASERIIRKKK